METKPKHTPIDQVRRFLTRYDKYAVNGARPGLADEFYGIDGGDGTTDGVSLHLSGLRAIVAQHDALVEAIENVLIASEDGGDMTDIDWNELRAALAAAKVVQP
jgi:hypothetical protein